MRSVERLSHRLAVATLLLLTMLACRAEAIAAQLTLTWTNNAVDAARFSVERSTGGTGAFAAIATTGAGVTTYVDPTVTDATLYCYRVRAFNPNGYSAYSNTACSRPFQPTAGLAVVKMGPGSGTVVSAPIGAGAPSEIICGMNCSGTFASGTRVTLTATAAAGSTFAGWSGGGCMGTGTCTLTLTATTVVTAAFNTSQTVSLTVTKGVPGSVTGNGTVTSTPAGINCGAICSATYPSGTSVTLTATPDPGFSFSGWSGACTGTGSCVVSMTTARTVTPTFTQTPRKP